MKNIKGFTIIETLMATIIIAGAFVVLGSSWSGSLLAVRKSRQLTTVALLLQKKTTEFELKFAEKIPEDETTEETGTFEDFPGFRWVVKTRKLELPDLAGTLTARDGGASEIEILIMKKLTETVQKTVREMKVSVFWKFQERENEYSITTYLVDYSKL